MTASKAAYDVIKLGDWVMAADNNNYGDMIGIVTAIKKHGKPDHRTNKKTDDIHVDFLPFNYPVKCIPEIEKRFSSIYNEPVQFNELSLDDVIMEPEMLIRLTQFRIDQITYMGHLRYGYEKKARLT